MTQCTAVGRIVWGHPMKATQQRDPTTKQLKFKQDGSPQMVHSFGLAVPKAEFIRDVWPAMDAERMSIFPNGAPQRFAWKYKDGDTVDGKGVPYANREGYAGCYVLNISSQTGFPPQVVKFENNQYRQLTEQEIKCGDFVAVGIDFKGNAPTNAAMTPGLYVNPTSILLLGYGTEIINRPDASTVFGAAPQFALPPGASATPVMPGGALPPGMQQMPGQPPAGAPQMPSGAPQAPAPGYPPQMPPAAVPPQGYQPQPYQPGPAPQYGAPPQMPPGTPQAPAPGYPPPATGYPPPATGFAAGGVPVGPAPAAYPPQMPPGAPQASAPGYPQPGAPMPGTMPPR